MPKKPKPQPPGRRPAGRADEQQQLHHHEERHAGHRRDKDRDAPALQPTGQGTKTDKARHHGQGDPEEHGHHGLGVQLADILEPGPGPEALDGKQGRLGKGGQRGDPPEIGTGEDFPDAPYLVAESLALARCLFFRNQEKN